MIKRDCFVKQISRGNNLRHACNNEKENSSFIIQLSAKFNKKDCIALANCLSSELDQSDMATPKPPKNKSRPLKSTFYAAGKNMQYDRCNLILQWAICTMTSFTTTTRILQGFAFLCKLRLLS